MNEKEAGVGPLKIINKIQLFTNDHSWEVNPDIRLSCVDLELQLGLIVCVADSEILFVKIFAIFYRRNL